MRVPEHVIRRRRDEVASLLSQFRYLPVSELCRRLKISEATARRDLAALERERRITRTYGGALSDYNANFPSFRQRQATNAAAKRQIGRAARDLLKPGQTCYLDGGTTPFAVAEALRENPVSPLTVVTCNIPCAELLAPVEALQIYLIGGRFLARQSVLLGDAARRSLGHWHIDVAFLGAEGLTTEGFWNSQEEIIRLQRAAARRAHRVILCADAPKLSQRTPFFVLPWSHSVALLSDATPAQLRAAGIHLPKDHFLRATEKST